MPTYEYRCQGCGHEMEAEQRITEDPLKKCPSCRKMKLQRLIGAGNFILKGGGWYADLYHKPKGGKSDGKSAESTSDSGSSDSSTADAGKGESKKKETKADSKKGGSKKAASG